MGPIGSKSYYHIFRVDGNNSQLWIINGVKFNISSITDQTIAQAINKCQELISANNRVIIITMMLIAGIVVLLILLLFLKHHYTQHSSNISANQPPLFIWTLSTNSDTTFTLKNTPDRARMCIP